MEKHEEAAQSRVEEDILGTMTEGVIPEVVDSKDTFGVSHSLEVGTASFSSAPSKLPRKS